MICILISKQFSPDRLYAYFQCFEIIDKLLNTPLVSQTFEYRPIRMQFRRQPAMWKQYNNNICVLWVKTHFVFNFRQCGTFLGNSTQIQFKVYRDFNVPSQATIPRHVTAGSYRSDRWLTHLSASRHAWTFVAYVSARKSFRSVGKSIPESKKIMCIYVNVGYDGDELSRKYVHNLTDFFLIIIILILCSCLCCMQF